MTLLVMRDKHEQTIMVTLPDRGSRDSSMLGLDTTDLQASLGDVQDLLQNLNQDEGLASLADNLATLNDSASLLDKVQQFEITPETQNILRQTEKLLQDLKTDQAINIGKDLKIGTNPI